MFKCVHSLGQLIKILRQVQMETVVDKLIEFSGGKDEELRDISALGMALHFDISSITQREYDVRHKPSKRSLQSCRPMGRWPRLPVRN